MLSLSDILMLVLLAGLDYLTIRFMLRKIISQAAHINRQIENGVIASGTIIALDRMADLDGHAQYAEVMKFTDNNKIEHIVHSDDYKMRKPVLNTQVTVCYNPGFPSEAIVNPHSQLNFKVFLICLILVIMISLNASILYGLLK